MDPYLEPAYCTTREAADQLGVSIGTVQAWVECGRLDAWKTAGGHRRVLRESIERLLRRPPRPGTPEPAGQPDAGPPSVVVVEQDVRLRSLYQSQLPQWPQNPRVHCFDNGVNALLHIGHSRPDLLILDPCLPGMDGFSLLRNLVTSTEIGTTAVAVVTGLSAADMATRGGVPSGVRQFGKPIPFQALQDLWTTVLANRSAQAGGAPGLKRPGRRSS